MTGADARACLWLEREAALALLAGRIAGLPLPARVAVDGVDAAGKTTLAAQLASRLRGASRVTADEFLRPTDERYARGRESPEGYYLDSFDLGSLRRAVLEKRGIVITDGVFLLRPELGDLWTFRIFVHLGLEESVRRGVERDGRAAERLYRRRYAAGQRLYLALVRPAELADVIFDNTDPGRPILSSGGGRDRLS